MIMEISKHAIFSIRYSLYMANSKAWKIGRVEDKEDYKKILFDPLRLMVRRKTFSSITLPSILAAIKNEPSINAQIHVLTSIYLPAEDKDFLNQLAINNKFLKVFYYDESNANLHISTVDYVNQSTKNGDVIASIRIDDDDAVSINFLSQLSKYLQYQFDGFIVSMCDGFGVLLNDKNQIVKISKYKWRFASVGLAYVYVKKNELKLFTVYQCGDHSKVDDKFPTILDGMHPSIVRSFNGHNDSGDSFGHLFKNYNDSDSTSLILEKFKLDIKYELEV